MSTSRTPRRNGKPSPPQSHSSLSSPPPVSTSEFSEKSKIPITPSNPDQEIDKVYTFTKLGKYRWTKDHASIELQVHWASGDITWEAEENLHADCKDALLSRWDEEEDGRPTNPDQPDQYTVFAITSHRGKGATRRVCVEWVGYKEATWESEKILRETVPELVDEYFDSLNEKKRKRETKPQATKTVAKKRTKV